MKGMPAGMNALSQAARPYVTAIHVLILMLDRSPSKSAPPVPDESEPVVTGK